MLEKKTFTELKFGKPPTVMKVGTATHVGTFVGLAHALKIDARLWNKRKITRRLEEQAS